MKIVLAEKVSPATLAVFAAEPGWEVLTHDKLPDGLPAALADADALVVRSAVQVDDALMEKAPKLRVIGRAGVGVDNIDAEAATRRGIVVMNTPGANAVAVAELTVGLMLALARKLPAANASMHAGKWEKKSLQGAELRGKTLGILGLGRIGLEVARRARGFGLEIIGSDPFVSAAIARENGILLVSLDELLAKAPTTSRSTSASPRRPPASSTPRSLAAMKKGVRIINCARGELVDEAALVDALKSGQVAGAALDVFTVEPPKDSPYSGLDNVILTPHIAGSTGEAQEAVGIQIARRSANTSSSASSRTPSTCRRSPTKSTSSSRPTSTWPAASDRSWRRPARAASRPSRSSTAARSTEAKTDLVRNAAIAGLLPGSENVNRINAAAVAEERGIRVHEEKQEGHPRRSGDPAGHRTAHRRRHQPRHRHRYPRRTAPPAGVRRHRCRGPARRHPAGLPQHRRSRRHRQDRNHPRRARRQHRQLRPGPRSFRS